MGVTFLIVPAIIGIVALIIVISGVRDQLQISRLTSQGKQARGRVISSNVHITSGSKYRTSRLAETIAYTTERGQQVRANPLHSDVGTLDRQGQEVPIIYDRQRPERMLAPKNGRSPSRAMPLLKIGGGLVLLGLAAGFMILTLILIRGILF